MCVQPVFFLPLFSYFIVLVFDSVIVSDLPQRNLAKHPVGQRSLRCPSGALHDAVRCGLGPTLQPKGQQPGPRHPLHWFCWLRTEDFSKRGSTGLLQGGCCCVLSFRPAHGAHPLILGWVAEILFWLREREVEMEIFFAFHLLHLIQVYGVFVSSRKIFRFWCTSRETPVRFMLTSWSLLTLGPAWSSFTIDTTHTRISKLPLSFLIRTLDATLLISSLPDTIIPPSTSTIIPTPTRSYTHTRSPAH